ncbi:MAG: hypothetical protein ACRDI0_04585 [Actinomycetota bacterium]
MSDAPGGAMLCAVCGESLGESAAPGELVTIGGRSLRFRRKTDFVVCPRCMALYRARDLLEGKVRSVSDQELLRGDEVEDRPR